MRASDDVLTRRPLRVVGLMCGTSIDAIDAAVVDINGSGTGLRVRLIGFQSLPVPPALRQRILQACTPGGGNSRLICELNVDIGEAFAEAALVAIAATGLQRADVDLIGSHGQTVWHQGRSEGGSVASTLQLGEPSIIAERTGITTVADFRPRDMAVGGQGAPLVSYLDWALYRSASAGRALQNIGGIANVTILPPGCQPGDVFAFDTGPGNMLLDALASLSSDGKLTYDRDGQLARAGHADAALLARIIAHPFFDLAPPRTAGREQFGQGYAQTIWQEGTARGLAVADMLATATLVTARSIADAYRRWVLPRVTLEGMYLSGGGARNPALLAALQRELPEVRQLPISALGGDAQAKEAVAFAVLAAETARNVPTSLPGATGAGHASV
ncbi:MAG TPA: anhydro-N-acetylmuramic acid kinase, partial [Chloroflexota bacterium]